MKRFSLPQNLLNFKLPLLMRLAISSIFLFQPLASCSSDEQKPPVIRSASVPDDGYKAPSKVKKQTEKPKPKIVSYRKHEPADA